MENITEALKMAAAILLFVGALSLTIATFTKVRQTSSAVMENSEKNISFYDNIDYSSEKVVGLETVVTNCYLYYKNYNTILFYYGSLDNSDNNVKIEGKMPLYYTESLPVVDDETGNKKINSNLLIGNPGGMGLKERKVYGLDINDERSRKEPWTGTDLKNRNFVTSFLKGDTTEAYNWSRTLYDNSGSNKYDAVNHKLKIGFLYTSLLNGNLFNGNSGNSNMKFVERVGTYKYEYKNQDNSIKSSNVSSTTQEYIDGKNEVVATLENNDEDTEVKKVIQYIYIPKIK